MLISIVMLVLLFTSVASTCQTHLTQRDLDDVIVQTCTFHNSDWTCVDSTGTYIPCMSVKCKNNYKCPEECKIGARRPPDMSPITKHFANEFNVTCMHDLTPGYDVQVRAFNFEPGQTDADKKYSAIRNANWACWSENTALSRADVECTHTCYIASSGLWIDLFSCTISAAPLVYDNKTRAKPSDLMGPDDASTKPSPVDYVNGLSSSTVIVYTVILAQTLVVLVIFRNGCFG